MRADLEERIATKIHLSSPVVPWMVRHAACLITRCRVRPNGKTAYQMMKGRRTHAKLACFVEIVYFKIPKTKLNPGTFEDRWDEGVWLGLDMRTAEYMIGTSVGVFRVATVRRKPIDARWSVARIRDMRTVPRSQCRIKQEEERQHIRRNMRVQSRATQILCPKCRLQLHMSGAGRS